jgi:hypothetical protein
MLFPAFIKRQCTISSVMTAEKLYLVFKFTQPRRKMLKMQRVFYCRVYFGDIDVCNIYINIKRWLDEATDDYILEMLEDTPTKFKPIFTIHPRIKLDFNVDESEVISYISACASEISS